MNTVERVVDMVASIAEKNNGDLVCNRSLVMNVMRQQQLLVTKLQALVLPLLPADDPCTELVTHLFEDLIRCNARVMSELQLMRNISITNKLMAQQDTTINITGRSEEEQQRRPTGYKRRRMSEEQKSSLITDTPHYDGHQWRKYGQKYISRMQYPRQELLQMRLQQRAKLPATKTIQQQDSNNMFVISSDDDTQYIVVYYGYHTCKKGNDEHFPLHNWQHTDHQNLFMTSELQEFGMGFDMPSQLDEFMNGPMVDPHSWVIDAAASS